MQRPGAEMGSFAVNTRAETTGIREFGRHVFEIAALSRASPKRYNLGVWVVGAAGIELATPDCLSAPRVGSPAFLPAYRLRGEGFETT
jgi:hypothetical protein